MYGFRGAQKKGMTTGTSMWWMFFAPIEIGFKGEDAVFTFLQKLII